MAKLYPSWPEIDQLIVPPEEGERKLLQFLVKTLDDSYEVYFQPNFNGLRPDIVIVRKHHGVIVVEVKDYNLNAYAPQNTDTWKVVHAQGQAIVRSPFAQAKRYKEVLYEFPMRLWTKKKVLQSSHFGIMQAVVFFSRATHKEVERFKPFPQYIDYWTPEDLQPNTFWKCLGEYMTERKSKWFTDDLYDELNCMLHPSLDKTVDYQLVPLDKKQREIVSQTRKSQKVRGVAGSGKTQVLAQKAIQLFLDTHKPVLILMYNITLRGYIHDRINQARYALHVTDKVPMDAFTILHYHAYAKIQDDDKPFENILIDEVQDFEREYVENIRKWSPKNKCMTFFCDEKQNIYSRKLEDKNKPYTGIGGEWNVLNPIAYRIKNQEITLLVSAFQKKYVSTISEYEPLQPLAVGLFDTPVYYSQLECFDIEKIYNLVRTFQKQVVEVFQDPQKKLGDGDMCLLSPVIEPLRRLRETFETHSYQVDATFETQEEYEAVVRANDLGNLHGSIQEALTTIRRPIKFAFRAGTGQLKFSTIHSFKGCQIPAVVLLLDNTIPISSGDRDIDNLDENKIQIEALLYTGMTRAEQFLYIIEISDSKFTPFFKQHTKPFKLTEE